MIFKILTMYYIGYGQVEVTTIIDPHIDQHPPFDWQSHILAGKRDPRPEMERSDWSVTCLVEKWVRSMCGSMIVPGVVMKSM